MTKKYKWGILAPGKMSAKFTRGLKLLDNVELYSVGSRDLSRAKQFANDFGFKKYFGSYEEFAADPDLEVVYIASPHSFHHDHTLLCLKNGKNVICEKAFALNSADADEMIGEAKRKNLFLMEALWPPFQPFYKKAFEILNSGILGNIEHLHGSFSFIPPFNPADRKFNLALGGGSLLDIGIYPVIDALSFLGVPSEIKASALFGKTGSEESLSVIFGYPDGKSATLYSSFRTSSVIGCTIFCEKGNLTVSRSRDMNQNTILELHNGEKKDFRFTPDAMGYHLEAEEVMRCLDLSLKESKVVPLSFSRDLMQTLDRIRGASGIVFHEKE